MAIRSSSVLAPEPEKITKTKSILTFGTPCNFLSIFILQQLSSWVEEKVPEFQRDPLRHWAVMAPPGVLCPTFPGTAITTPRQDWRPAEAWTLTLHVFILKEAAGKNHKTSRGSDDTTQAGPHLKEPFLWGQVRVKTRRPPSCWTIPLETQPCTSPSNSVYRKFCTCVLYTFYHHN